MRSGEESDHVRRRPQPPREARMTARMPGSARPGAPRPGAPQTRAEVSRARRSERARVRRYFTLMITCLLLISLAWFWVRLYSTTAAVVMSMIAAVLPPIAVIVANFGVQ